MPASRIDRQLRLTPQVALALCSAQLAAGQKGLSGWYCLDEMDVQPTVDPQFANIAVRMGRGEVDPMCASLDGNRCIRNDLSECP